MASLISFFNVIFGLCFLIGLMVAALTMPVAPAWAKGVLKRLGLALMLWVFMSLALCPVERELAGLEWPMRMMNSVVLALLLFSISGTAYVVYRLRRRSEKKPPDLHGSERTPLLPQHSGHLIREEKRNEL